MKTLKITLACIALLAIGITITSCGNGDEKKSETMMQEHSETATHACPMHPEITGAEGDKCSKCGMDLTPISGDDHARHNHD